MYFHLNSNSRHESCQEKQLIEYNETGIINSEQFRAGTSGAPLNANISKAFISPTSPSYSIMMSSFGHVSELGVWTLTTHH